MKDSSWNDCVDNDSVIKVSTDKFRAKSLIETAEARVKLIKEVNELNCNFVFEDN